MFACQNLQNSRYVHKFDESKHHHLFQMNNLPLQQLQAHIAPIRQTIVQHPLYAQLHTIEDLQIFMQHHVFAVWDFMSLLKTLQRALTCVDVPWLPVGNADVRYLINEIVIGEESDVDAAGKRMSHFELYEAAMQAIGCDMQPMHTFLNQLRAGVPVAQALLQIELPATVRTFVQTTFDIIQSGKPHVQAAVFTFGREDLIPDMFMTMVQELHRQTPDRIEIFKYYLERHIEVDGDHHSHLAYQMTAELCGNDAQKWAEATDAVEQALIARRTLWDGVLAAVQQLTTI